MRKYVIIIVLGLSTAACNKSTNCYNADLQKEYEHIVCTADCPGVTGCDGEFYCNACVAGANGIGPE